jgi:TP901 family phage tail tape measure protein
MAVEVVTIKVGVSGDTLAIQNLQRLDTLIDQLNKKTVNIKLTGSTAATIEKSASALDKLGASMEKVASSSGKMNISTQGVNGLAKSSTEAGNAANTAATQTDKFSESTQKLKNNASYANQTITNMVGKFAQWYLIGNLVSAPVSAFKDAVQELKNVDSELVSIQKVMGASASEMDRLSEKAYPVGSNLGVAASDYLASVTQWAQAGYGSLSDELGELSVMTQKVGDVDQATANQFLLSVDAAYQYQGSIESLTRVLDGANELSNNFATSVEKLAGGMGIVSSLAAQAGMAVEETAAAIGTITAVTQESGNSAARALRALILNIQGETNLEIDEVTGERWTEEEINKTAEAIQGLNVATREYKDGILQLRNPMEVIGEISEKYREGLISEVQLQELVSSLGGKTRSNQLQALITNFDMYEDQVETFVNATGSAERELDIYLNSWEAKANRVQNGWVQLVENMKTSEISKGLLDVANALLTIANSDLGQTIIQITMLTAAVTALTLAYEKFKAAQAAGTLTELKGLPALFSKISKIDLASIFTNAGTAIKGAASAITGAGGLAGAISSLSTSALAMAGVIGAIVTAGVLAFKAVDSIIVTAEEQKELAVTAGEEYQSAAVEVENLNKQLEDTNKQISDLESKGKLSLTDQKDLQNLEEQQKSLEAQLAIAESIKKVKEETAVSETQQAIEKGFSQGWFDLGKEIGFNDAFDPSHIYEGWENQIGLLTDKLEEFRQKRDELSQKGDSLNWFEQKDLEDTNEDITALTSTLGEMASELQTYYDNLDGVTGEQADAIRAQIMSYLDAINYALDPVGTVIDKIDDALNNLSTDELQSFNDALNELRSDGELTADEIMQLADTFPFLSALMDESGVSAQQLADYFLQTGTAAGEAGSDIERLKKIINPLSEITDSASQALKDFQEAVDAEDFDDIYDGYSDAIDRFFEDYEQGMRNSQAMWAAADLFFTPEQLEAMGWDIDTIATKLQEMQKYFTGDPTQFYDQVAALAEAGELINENGEALAEMTENGLRIPVENFDEIAEKLGISEEAFASLIQYVGMFSDAIIDIDLSAIEDYVNDMGLVKEIGEEQVINADELEKQLREAGASTKDITQAFEKLESAGYTVVSVTEEVENLKDMLADLGAAEQKNGKLEIRISNYAQLMDQLGYTKEQAAELLEKLYSAGNVSFVDTEGNTISLQQAIDQVTTSGLEEQFNKLAGTAEQAAGDIKIAFQRAVNYVNGLTLSPKVKMPEITLPTIPTGWTTSGSDSQSSDKKATGTNFANGGPTLLGDEQGVGPKPELVIDGDQAFLAGQNGPEVVNLSPGARVLTNTETKRALNGTGFDGAIPAMAGGSAVVIGRPNYNASADSNYKGSSSSSSSSGSSGSSSSGGGTKASTVTITQKSDDGESYWDKQREALDEYLDALDTATEVIEYEQEDSYQKQIANFQAAQSKIHATANDFRARGLKDTDNEIQELKLKWHEYADKIEDVYKAMYDDLKEMHNDDQWELDLLEKNRERADRSVVEIAADNQEIVATYKRMQQEVHDLANYYRSQGYDETSDYIQDLSDAWWEYQDAIESVYENLTDSLDKYIEKSKNKLEELEHTGASVGEKITVYIERIQKAQETLAALKFTNKNGVNDEAISDVQNQIWSDQDAIKNIQDSLWDELGNALDEIFEEKQNEIDLIDKQIDQANKRIDQYKKQLDDILNDPSITGTDVGITDLLERLNDNLDAEKDALESIVEPLENQINGYYQRDEDGNLEYIEGLTDKIEGYYKRDAEGNLIYVEGLQDLLDAENERYNAEKEERDEQLQLEKKQLAVQEAIKNLQQAQLDLETAKNERPLYTLKDGVWAWRPDEEAIKNAQEAVEDAEQAKEDAENDLYEYEEDLKHQQIIDGLQDQIDAIEKQKEEINKQIDLYQKESKARQKYLQSQIDYWEKEKEAYEKHYDELIEVQEDIIAAKEEERDALKEDLEKWKEEWEDITDSLKEPVRDIKDILMDIAKYGTPAMQEQVENVTDLLAQLGHALENFNPEYGGDNDWGNGDYMQGFKDQVIEKMKENSVRWHIADDEEKKQLEREQNELGQSIGASYDDHTGLWSDENGDVLYDMSDAEMQEIVARLMKQNSDAWHDASASEKSRLEAENQALGDLIDAQYDEHTGKWYASDGSPLFDTGGIARGLGVMQKATTEDEVVLSPALSNLVLTPQKNREFAQFAQSMGLLFGAAQHFGSAEFSREAVSNSVTDRHDITINGVTIGESMLRRPLSDTLSLLALHRNEY